MANFLTDMIEELTTYFLRRDPWQTWTPVLDQNGTVTATINKARYLVAGDTIDIYADLTVTGTGTAGTEIEISGFPFAPDVPAGEDISTIGFGMVRDSGAAASYFGFLVQGADATAWRLRDSNTRLNIGANPSFGLANPDRVVIRARYEKV